jgi:hypothetical protein
MMRTAILTILVSCELRGAGAFRAAADQQQQLQRLEKTLSDYQTQAHRPFEHEAQLKELLARQAQLLAGSKSSAALGQTPLK